ncbi:phosphatase PAP2 family protein [Microbacterium sp. ARD31]|uniref:phosphatase PAP2 family protein n=1 Tax=Microbacterium sp. ARD31 TaxID=2962576 RepID=UPI0028826350|nr:phosphatase PAP2 family protein [Microbacterium sp. ARD31]MDT0183467.1 phosphatase PAP2 family protein [Microbacterium sp. ARD31]
MEVVDRRPVDALACLAGLAVTGAAAAVADRHPAAERRLFSLINDHGSEPRLVRALQQAGTPWVLPLTAATALLLGRRRLAVRAALALPVEKALEVGIKKARPVPRPLYVEPTVLRDDAPVEGGSYPSGHAAIATTAACLVAPHLPPAVRPAVLAVGVGSGLVRVSQGAHHPVDAVGGTALGVAISAGIRLALGR